LAFGIIYENLMIYCVIQKQSKKINRNS